MQLTTGEHLHVLLALSLPGRIHHALDHARCMFPLRPLLLIHMQSSIVCTRLPTCRGCAFFLVAMAGWALAARAGEEAKRSLLVEP